MSRAHKNQTSSPTDSSARRGDQTGQISVEYALAAAVLVAVASAVIGLFPAIGIGRWVDTVSRAVLVRVDGVADSGSVARELMDR